MNRRARQAFLRDVRLAARLRHPDALDAALETLRADPAIASNRVLPPDLVQRVLVPAGQALAAAPTAYLQDLARSPLAAFRVLAAAAWAQRFAQGRAEPRALEALARDRRDEVRAALIAGLTAAPAPQRAALTRAWLTPRTPPRSPRVVALAWDLARDTLPPAELWNRALDWASRDEAIHLRDALVRALQHAASQDPHLALKRLRAALEQRRLPPPWIAQVLAGPWAARYPAQVLPLLRELYRIYGRRRWLTQALQALERRGALDDATARLQVWAREDAA